MNSKYTITTTKDNERVLTFTCPSKNPNSLFTEFSQEHPELRVTKLIGVQHYYSSKDLYTYSLEIDDDPDNIHHQQLYWGNCRASENPEPVFQRLIHQSISDKCVRERRFYSFIPHQMQIQRIGKSQNGIDEYLVLSDILETERTFEGITVPPAQEINSYLKNHPDLRLIGLCNGDNEKREAPSWASKSGTYQKHYSVTALFASIKDFPELAKIKSQGVLALVDHPSNSIESQTQALLKKRNDRVGLKPAASEYVVALKYPIGKTFLDQENDNGNVTMTLQDGSSHTIAGYCNQCYIVINEQDRQIASPIKKKPDDDDRLVPC